MQLYGHKHHNCRNDANFRKLTGKVLCIAFKQFWLSQDFFRSSVTLCKIWYCFCELFYSLSVKNHREKRLLKSCAVSTIFALQKWWMKPVKVFASCTEGALHGTQCRFIFCGKCRKMLHKSAFSDLARRSKAKTAEALFQSSFHSDMKHALSSYDVKMRVFSLPPSPRLRRTSRE